jgi:hypothetical protein
VEFPYADLISENVRRTSHVAEYELFDAIPDVFRQQRYFDVFIEYAKHDLKGRKAKGKGRKAKVKGQRSKVRSKVSQV